MSDSSRPSYGQQLVKLLCPWDFSRQEYWNGLPLPPPGDLFNQRIEPTSPVSPALVADSLPAEPLGSPLGMRGENQFCLSVWVIWARRSSKLVQRMDCPHHSIQRSELCELSCHTRREGKDPRGGAGLANASPRPCPSCPATHGEKAKTHEEVLAWPMPPLGPARKFAFTCLWTGRGHTASQRKDSEILFIQAGFRDT